MKGIGIVPIKDALPVAPFEWLLRDEFTDVRAAGAVNGTPATPGPGTRVVVDTDVDALSVGGGVMAFANPNAVWGDPGLWYGAVSRVAGRVLVVQITHVSTITFMNAGWDANQAGQIANGINFWNAQRIALSAALVIGTYAATTYTVSVVLRAAGLYYFIRGGAFPAWTLLWIDSVVNTDPIYPSIGDSSSLATSSFIRIPVHLYLPTPLAYDTFTRANGPLGNTEGTGPDGQAVSARAWINRVGTTLVAGNAASASALVGGIAIATVTTEAADVIAQATLTRAGGDVGIVLRYADAINYVIGYHDGVNARLDKIVAGVTTNVITAAVAIGAGEIVVICEGTQFSLFLNNVKIGATGTINDVALQNGTEQGLYSTNVGNTQDVFLDMARGGGAYDGLDKYAG